MSSGNSYLREKDRAFGRFLKRIHIKMIDIIRTDAFLWDFKQKTHGGIRRA